jgi:hypothetical protein
MVWWYMPVIPAIRRLRQFEASLGYIVRPCLKRPKVEPKQDKEMKLVCCIKRIYHEKFITIFTIGKLEEQAYEVKQQMNKLEERAGSQK